MTTTSAKTAPSQTSVPAQEGAATSLAERVASVARVAEEHLEATDRDAVFPEQALAQMRRTGLLGLLVPAEHGGCSGTLTDLVDAGMALGRVDMSVGMIFAMHCQQSEAIVRYAASPLREELLAQLSVGDLYLASVTTEPGKGGHLFRSYAPLQESDDTLMVDRVAPIVTGGAAADGFLITMRSPHATADHHVSLVYAHRHQLRIEGTGEWCPMGMRASHSLPLTLTGSIPAHQVIGEHGAFHQIAQSVFGPLAHIGWSAVWLGTAAGALSRVLRLLRDPAGRKRFNLSSELLMTRLSRVRQRLDTVHALLRRTEALVASGADLSGASSQLLLNSLKITASEECYRAVDELVDAVGLRHGYLRDSPTRLEKSLRDLRSAALNYSNDRLHLADGQLCLLDPNVRFV
ncbi:acyl-CoA/acyl-ACP dehydrogenase [Streptomyces hirsutus]|uniref:Acyl-CoA/acyl-ACP dehydrogenase n=1 Tax=Streptomyces hirsutus TaxID=35620 RepID=A0ABZ1GE38_9ACTN|nr:acyl-CoA dehydrogenase family protein [Streptomyces hirsutus]WSD04359.1 acyl-CoA/acyl-ACP dehydrogenase [Streptomyces hirsutus]WTD22253.1 acyl-CoA/acyl-ACP dehydrogenase [Streptomyces hirsutus]WTD72679.1 acyl-CoA/acyl-ACP dehydrogenase [Streptomyces sp. NBC_01635]